MEFNMGVVEDAEESSKDRILYCCGKTEGPAIVAVAGAVGMQGF
jgi:hypothetical protein